MRKYEHGALSTNMDKSEVGEGMYRSMIGPNVGMSRPCSTGAVEGNSRKIGNYLFMKDDEAIEFANLELNKYIFIMYRRCGALLM